MAALATQVITVAGLTPTFVAAAAGGDTAPVGDREFLVVQNGSGAPVTVTLATPGNLATGDAYPDKAYSVAAGAETWIPLPAVYRDPTDGRAHITYSAAASVTVAVVRR